MSSLSVLTIAHNAVAGSNRRRVEALQALPDVNVTLLTPRWWFEEGRRIELPRSTPWRVGRTLAAGNGTRHVYASGLVQAIRATRPDVIDLFEEPFSFVALQTLVLRELLAPSAALIVYSAVNVERQWRWPYRAIERLVLGRADGAHAPNADVPRILRAKGLTAPSAVVPLGVAAEHFTDANAVALPSVPRPRVGFIGRLEPVKGLDVLLDAFQRMRSGGSLVIAGDGSERQRLQARAGERVHFTGAVAYEDVPCVLKAFDVLVLPSVTTLPLHREQFGRVLVEAMAAGVPVIGSDSGAIPEVIGDAGLVVPERNADALAAALDRVLGDEALRHDLVSRGKRRVSTRFAWPVVARQTLDLFRDAVVHRKSAIGRRLAEARA